MKSNAPREFDVGGGGFYGYSWVQGFPGRLFAPGRSSTKMHSHSPPFFFKRGKFRAKLS